MLLEAKNDFHEEKQEMARSTVGSHTETKDASRKSILPGIII
jgi:hypothetical protein